jgi:exodeoxyribonuclease VII small subunit
VNAAPSYETNVARVEEIVRRLDTGEASLSETLELVREGRDLIERCARELDAVSGALEELRLEDLVARLEAPGRDRAGQSATGRDTPSQGAAGRDTAGRGTAGTAEPGADGANGERAA